MTVLTAFWVFLALLSCSDLNWKLTLWLCCPGEMEQRPNICWAFLTGVFLGHVFFDTSLSNLCISAHKTRYCADQTLQVLMGLVMSLPLLGLGRSPNHIIPASGWPALLPYWSTAAWNHTSMSRRDFSGRPLHPTTSPFLLTVQLQRCIGICKGVGGRRCKDQEKVNVNFETKWYAFVYLIFFNNFLLQVYIKSRFLYKINTLRFFLKHKGRWTRGK